jgi:acetyl-CoA carboxylase biotin carboxyl carrier protein
MELDKIKELVAMMDANDLSELEIVDGQSRIMLKRGGGQIAPQIVTMPPVMSAAQPASVGDVTAVASEDSYSKIIAPMVGTYYPAPSPNADPFVKTGDHVDEETVIGIVEAMKVMNEIKSEIKGTIKKSLVGNGESVEYGQALFLVEAD